MMSIFNNFTSWLADGWDILCNIFMWLLHGFTWILGLLMLIGCIFLVYSLFWKGEDGKESRKACAWHVAVFGLCGLLAFGMHLYDRSPKVIESKASSIMSKIPSTVYVCTGPKSKRYHYDMDCRGLQSCSGDIVERDIEEAYDSGYTPCGWCAK